MTDAHAVGCDIWRGGECSCRNRDPAIFGGPDIEEEVAALNAEIERLRDQVTRLSTLVDTERSLHDAEIERLRKTLGE